MINTTSGLKCELCGLDWKQIVRAGRLLRPYKNVNPEDTRRKYACEPTCEHVGDRAMRALHQLIGGASD